MQGCLQILLLVKEENNESKGDILNICGHYVKIQTKKRLIRIATTDSKNFGYFVELKVERNSLTPKRKQSIADLKNKIVVATWIQISSESRQN